MEKQNLKSLINTHECKTVNKNSKLYEKKLLYK